VTLVSRILVVDDEPSILAAVAPLLRARGYEVFTATSGQTGIDAVDRHAPDLVILDLGLPDIDGIEVCRRLREGRSTPIVILSARGAEAQKVAALDAGADDYVTKPFGPEELLARLRALIRRSTGQVAPELRCGSLVLDPRGARVTVGGLPVKLTSHEFRVLSYLMHHRGRLVPQAELVDHIYAHDADRDSNTVEVFIARLRRKIGASFIETVRGLGYRITEPAP
jgi:two-component system OmpR family response regulator